MEFKIKNSLHNKKKEIQLNHRLSKKDKKIKPFTLNWLLYLLRLS